MWYVLQVRTETEANVRRELQQLGYHAMVPIEDRPIRSGGGWKTKQYVAFSGYVFLSLDYTAENYYRIINIPNVVCFLGGGMNPSALSYSEAEWIKTLSCGGKPIQPTKVKVLTNGTVKVLEGILQNFPSRIIKYNKHSRRATAELTICGKPKKITLAIEIV